jgi:predicted nucleic acid-binding Zn ribbon protein
LQDNTNTMTEANPKCPECGYEITGRSDKKFCSDQCRNTFNNRFKKDTNNYVRKVNSILRKNRRILTELNPTGKSKIHKKKLIEKGFDFDYFTNIYRTKTGNVYRFCYEQGFLALEDEMFALVVRQEYMNT